MEIMMITGFLVLAAFLVYWVIDSTRMENQIEQQQNYIDTLEEMNRIRRKWDHLRESSEQSSES